ncbi:MAG: ATP-binding protein, partial [Fimbriiglobus sp.]
MAWADLRGHDAARLQLLTAFARGRLAHAYLFVGPDGVGKRRFATEFAKSLLCEAPPGPLAMCDRCPACVQVADGTHPDFFAARTEEEKNQLSIEVMREFVHRLGLKSSRGTHKIGVVEDADEFNESSANAFLKPLEEPPPGTTLVLLATSLEKQMPTILSRCQVVPFRPLGRPDLDAVLTAHGVTDPAKRDRLARLSGGSPGRALALNDDDLWDFRETLLAAVTAERPDPGTLAGKWCRFVEDAGKQAPAQRERAALVLHLLVDMLRQALR